MLTEKFSQRVSILSLFILILAVSACTRPNETNEGTGTPDLVSEPTQVAATAVSTETAANPTPDQTSQGTAYIDSLTVNVLETTPVQVQATVSGNLSDGCTTLEDIDVELMGVTFILNAVTSYSDTLGCIQSLIPFEQTVFLDVEGLSPGTYSVAIDNLSETFTLTAATGPPAATPEPGMASLSATPGSSQPGGMVTLTGTGFPAATTIDIGFGRVNSEYDVVTMVQSDANGAFTADVVVPDFADPADQWVFVAEAADETVVTPPLTITQAESGGDNLPEAEVNVPVNGLFQRTYMYLVAQEDGGQSGPLIGCNDSLVPVIIEIEPTVAPMTAAINRLLSLSDQFYGQSGLYNALYQSDLTLEGINIVNREAIISLSGNVQLGGTCDTPRLLGQLEYTAVQYSTVDSATILLNGQNLEAQLSSQ